jgi:hypothetical protein
MSSPLRTNPALAHLAYKKAIVNRTIAFLRRQYIGDETSDPRETLICEEVYPVDSHVPPEAIQHYLEGLAEEVAQLDLEIRKFDFTTPTQKNHEQKRSKGAGQQGQKGGQGQRHGGRSH